MTPESTRGQAAAQETKANWLQSHVSGKLLSTSEVKEKRILQVIEECLHSKLLVDQATVIKEKRSLVGTFLSKLLSKSYKSSKSRLFIVSESP